MKALSCLRCVVPLFMVATSLSVSDPVAAQARESSSVSYEFSLTAQSLADSLVAVSELTGMQLIASSELTRGRSAAEVKGRLSMQEALSRLLAGTGLTYRFIDARTISIEALRSDRRVLGPVRVEGADAQVRSGANGSTDPTATERTGSYTSSALSIASKAPQSIKETPQSVSVITQQRLQDQNLTDLTSTLNQAPGITLVKGDSLISRFYSRGFQVTNIQIDGGAPFSTKGDYGFVPLIDMAQYDHVELLRGADGLFNGYGAPGGTINLVRKRPLDHGQVVLEASVGSWNNYRTMLDASAPLGFDGRLRGRAIISYQDQEYFYDTATNNHTLSSGTLEADVLPGTLLSVGASLSRNDATPCSGGLPRYSNGDDLRLPRSTCLATTWGRMTFDTQELFVQAEQQIGARWSANLKVSGLEQSTRQKTGYVAGAVDPATGTGPRLYGTFDETDNTQHAAELTVRGRFDLFGDPQQLVLGANYQKVDAGGSTSFPDLYPDFPPVEIDVAAFDPAAHPEPASPRANMRYPDYGWNQWGAYANLNLTLFERLHIPLGIRWSSYELKDRFSYLDETGAVVQEQFSTFSGDDFASLPFANLMYDITKRWSVYGSYSTIYESQANLLDRNGQPLEPVTGNNWELGVKGALRDDKLNLSLSAYRLEQKNFGAQDTSVPGYGNGTGVACCFYTLGSDRVYFSQGADLEVSGEVISGLQVSLGYTYNTNEYRGSTDDGQVRDGEALHSYTPHHLFKLWSSYRLGGAWHRLSVSGGVNAQTESYYVGLSCTLYGVHPRTGKRRCEVWTPYDYTQGFYAVFSAAAAYQLDQRWNVALNVNNVTDRTYYVTPGNAGGGNWYGEPRSFMLTLRGNF